MNVVEHLISLGDPASLEAAAEITRLEARVAGLLEANNREVERRRSAEALAAQAAVEIETLSRRLVELQPQPDRETRRAQLHDPAYVCPDHGVAWVVDHADGTRLCGWGGCAWDGVKPTVEIPHEGKVR